MQQRQVTSVLGKSVQDRLITLVKRFTYMFELLLDDLLSDLESKGIDTSKLHLVEEFDTDVEPFN